MEQTSSPKRFITWGIFIIIVALIIWGLVAAEKKSSQEAANLVLPSQIVDTDHSRGSLTAPVTLVEYGDFQCPACGIYYPMVEQVVKDIGPTKLREIFRNFPLPQHGNAIPAAKAAEAADLQGKYWDMYNILYSRQESWQDATDPKTVFIGYAKELGLDTTKFSSDFELQSVSDRIQNDYKGGAAGGINQTPSFFLNGKLITAPASVEEFEKIINDAANATATTTAQ